MEYKLDKNSLATFQNDFGRLHDSVIRRYEYIGRQKKEDIEKLIFYVEAFTMSESDSQNNRVRLWGMLTLEFQTILQMSIVQSLHYQYNVIFSCKISVLDDSIIVDFTGTNVDDPIKVFDSDPQKVKTLCAIRAKECLIHFELFSD